MRILVRAMMVLGWVSTVGCGSSTVLEGDPNVGIGTETHTSPANSPTPQWKAPVTPEPPKPPTDAPQPGTSAAPFDCVAQGITARTVHSSTTFTQRFQTALPGPVDTIEVCLLDKDLLGIGARLHRIELDGTRTLLAEGQDGLTSHIFKRIGGRCFPPRRSRPA